MAEAFSLSNLTNSVFPSNFTEVITAPFRNSIDLVLNIAKIAGVLFIAYLIFLIIKALVSIGNAHRIKRIANDVSSINDKLDVLIKNTTKLSYEDSKPDASVKDREHTPSHKKSDKKNKKEKEK